jgi:hypothetical protein
MNATADPRLIAAIRARKAALAAGASASRRFTMTPRVPAPPEPPPAPTPPTPDPTPPDPTAPDTDDVFGAAAAERVYAARQAVVRGVSAARLSALDVHTGAGSEVTSRSVPTGKPTPPRWPDATETYERRKQDVRRAQQQRRRRE